ncbi:MAG: hypothetical protein ABIR83_07345 [Nakamurella sp.]
MTQDDSTRALRRSRSALRRRVDRIRTVAAVALAALLGAAIIVTGGSPADAQAAAAADGRSVDDAGGDATTTLIYVGEWSIIRDPALSGGSSNRSTVRDSLVSVRFTGTGVTVVGSTGPDHGTVEFTVDGAAGTTRDLYSRAPTTGTALFAVNGLTPASHVVSMRVTGDKGSASTGTAASLDRVGVSTAVAAVAPTSSGFVTRSGSRLMLGGAPFRFAGANLYWLGLDDNLTDAGGATYPTKYRIDNGLQSAKNAGLTVIRSHTLGISVGCARCIEPTLGTFNDAAFQSADYAIYRAGQLGLKIVIPLTDQWRWYHGGISTFTGWRGYPNYGGADGATKNTVNAANNSYQRASEAHFYSDTTVSNDFKQYVTHLLQHVNPYTGLAYKDDPTIMAWETGNEIWTANPTWTQDIAWFVKHNLAARQLVADGTAASGMQVANAAVDAPDVDILGGHFYPVDTAWMKRDAALAAAKGKAYLVGEYAWTDAAATTAQLAAVEADPNVAGNLVWTLMPYKEDGIPEIHGDGYALYYPATSPAMTSVMDQIRRHAQVMSGR